AKADRSLLPNADVEVSGLALSTPLRTKSADDGHFSFQRLIPGLYTVTVSHDGFQEHKVDLALKPREVQNITVELSIQEIVQSVNVTTRGETYSPNSTTLQKQGVDDLPADQRNN